MRRESDGRPFSVFQSTGCSAVLRSAMIVCVGESTGPWSQFGRARKPITGAAEQVVFAYRLAKNVDRRLLFAPIRTEAV